MKKCFLLILLCFCLQLKIFSEEMQLYRNDTGSQLFRTLSVEEQYNSIINSFRGKESISQANKWVSRMIEQYGREVLPYMNNTLFDCNFDHINRETINYTSGLFDYLFYWLREGNYLTEEETILYQIVIKGKVKEYILKYRVIDGTVRLGYNILDTLNYTWSKEEYLDSEALKAYFEKELGITGIVAGNIESVFDVTPSPLAEYITD